MPRFLLLLIFVSLACCGGKGAGGKTFSGSMTGPGFRKCPYLPSRRVQYSMDNRSGGSAESAVKDFIKEYNEKNGAKFNAFLGEPIDASKGKVDFNGTLLALKEKTPEEMEIARDIASGQCVERRAPQMAEKYKGVCGDWWEPIFDEGDEDKAAKYPSYKICECFAERFVKNITEQVKRDLAAEECRYYKDYGGWGNSPEYERFLEFGTEIWKECNKEVPRWIDDLKAGEIEQGPAEKQ